MKKALLLINCILLCILTWLAPTQGSAQSVRITTIGDNTVNMLLVEKQGDAVKQYIAKLKGSLSSDVQGKIQNLNGTIQSLESEDGKSVKVVKSELTDGALIIATEDGRSFVIFDLNSNLVGKIRASSETDVPATAALSQTPPQASELTSSSLREGGTAFIRVKEYTTLSGDPTVQDGMGGTGYVLRNLHPESVSAPVARPTDKDATFSFGESVTLVERKGGLPVLWLVAKGEKKVWIPAYLLTPNKAEINFLKDKGRIPDSMVFVYDDGNWKTWGTLVGGIANSAIVDSHGIALLDYPKGTSPFAIRGNAVLFDASVAKATWKKPPVFDGEGRPLDLSPAVLYYCVSDGDKTSFECMNLATLSIAK